MNLKFILIISLFVTSLFSSPFNANKLTKSDIKLLKQIKKVGERHGLSYSLMAIAIKESSLGRYIINVDSKDFGLYQANIRTVISRERAKNTSWNRNKYAMMLISNVTFATNNAIAELKYWKKVHKNDWKKTWGSYNEGWHYDSKKAKRYSQDIENIIKKLKKINV